MLYNSKEFLADRERLLEPDQQLRGTYVRAKEIRKPAISAPIECEVSEYEQIRREDEFLKQHGV